MARVKRPANDPPANRRRTRQRTDGEPATTGEAVAAGETIIGPPQIRNPSPPPRRPAPRRPTPPPRVPSPPPRTPSPPPRNPSPPPPLPFRPNQQPDLNLTPQPSPVFEEDQVPHSNTPDDPLTAMVLYDPSILERSQNPPPIETPTATPVETTPAQNEPLVITEEQQVNTGVGTQSMEEIVLEELAEDLGVDIADLVSDAQERGMEPQHVDSVDPVNTEHVSEPEQTQEDLPVKAKKKQKALGKTPCYQICP